MEALRPSERIFMGGSFWRLRFGFPRSVAQVVCSFAAQKRMDKSCGGSRAAPGRLGRQVLGILNTFWVL